MMLGLHRVLMAENANIGHGNYVNVFWCIRRLSNGRATLRLAGIR